VGHGSQQVHVGLMLERDVAFKLRQQMLLQFPHRSLPVKKIADEESNQRAEPEECHTQRPPVAVGVNENQRVHESGQAASQDENEDHRKDCQLQFAALQLVELFAIEDCGAHTSCAFSSEELRVGIV